jgi:hypothetical protein
VKPQLDDATVVKSMLNLRDELTNRAFFKDGSVRDTGLAEVVWKLNACLYRGYKLDTESHWGTVTESATN